MEPAADHGLQITGARDRQCWQMAGRDRSGIQEPCSVENGPHHNPSQTSQYSIYLYLP